MTDIKVKRFTTTDSTGKTVTFTVDSQIMDYIEPARTFGIADLAEPSASRRYQPNVVAIPDRRQTPIGPMVLTLGSDQMLRLVRRVASGKTALSAHWEAIDLSAGFAHIAKGKVTAFAAAWTALDAITVAVAVESDEPSRRSKVLIAYDLNSRTTDWSKIPWVNYGSRDKLIIDGMRVAREPDGKWMTVMSAGSGFLSNTYVIRQGGPESFQNNGLVYSTATDVIDIADFQVGAIRDGAALHVLGTNQDNVRTLFSRKVPVVGPDGRLSAPPVLTFDCPAGARRLALGLAREKHGADLYVGGHGVMRLPAQEFPRQEDARYDTVIPPAMADGVEHVVAAESEDGAVTVWALDGQGRLVMAGRRAGQARWETALPLRSGVREIAPVPGDGVLTTSLLVVYQGGRAGNLWRDAQGVWQEEAIVVADQARACNVLTFQTVVCVTDEAGLARGGVDVTIGASVASTLVVNGRSHFVCPGHEITVKAGFDGKVTLVNRALSFAPATYRLKVAGWSRAVDINPACPLYARFATLSVKELRDAKAAGGAPLLDEAYRSGTRAGEVDTLLQSFKKAATLITGKDGGTDGVWLVDSGQEISSKVSAGSLPDSYAWGMSADGQGGLKGLDAAAAARLAGQAGGTSAGALGVNLSISDVWEAFLSGAGKVVAFVIRKVADVVEFVCDIGGRVGRFILTTIEEIGAFFKWAWSAIKAKAEEVWDFLKFLFDWDDIIAVRDKLKEIIHDQLEDMTGQILSLKDKVGPAFDAGLAQVRQMAASQGLVPSAESLRQPGSGALAKAQKAEGDVRDSVLNSGPGSWILEQFNALSNALIKVDIPESKVPDIDLTTLLSHQLDRLTDICSTVSGDVTEIFGGKSPSLSDLDLDKIQRLIIAVTLRVAESTIAVAREVTMLLIDALAGLVDALRRILYARVSLPMFEALWKLATGKTADLSFSIIDVVLLPPAVLGTIIFKLVFPRQDIKPVLAQRLPPAGVFGVQSSGLMMYLYFIKDSAATIISFISTTLDAGAAAVSVAQPLISKWDWFRWSATGSAHVLGAGVIFSKLSRSVQAGMAELVIWLIGFIQLRARFHALKAPMMESGAYTIMSQGVALIEVGCGIVKMLFKMASVMVAAGKDCYDVMEVVQFYGANISSVAMNVARLNPEPESKEAIVLFGLLVGLFLNLGCGLMYNCLFYGEAASPAVV